MKVEVGQWVRNGRNIGTITKVCVGGCYIKCNTLRNPFNYIDGLYYKDWKVANTPQELVKLYDIVELRNGYTFKIVEIKNKKVYDRLGDREFKLEDITAIYTPNKYKTLYTLQWRKEASNV